MWHYNTAKKRNNYGGGVWIFLEVLYICPGLWNYSADWWSLTSTYTPQEHISWQSRVQVNKFVCNGMGYRQLNATVFAISHRFYLFIYLIPLGFDATFLHGLTWLCICSPSLSVIVSCSFDHFLFWPHVYFPTMHILFGSNYSNCIYRHTHGYLQAMFMCYTPTWMPLGEYL